MSDIILLTQAPVFYNGVQTHPVWSAVDIRKYGTIDLAIGIIDWAGTASGTLSIRAVTGFDTEQDDASWYPAAGTPSPAPNIPDVLLPFPSTPYWFKATLRSGNTSGTPTPLGSYLRWEIQTWGLNGLSSVTFVIWGIGRDRVPAM